MKAPSVVLLAFEIRASWEWGAGLLALPFLQRLPKGDGHPVLVFPGLGAGDYSTAIIRRFLKRQGYDPHPWNFGINLGPRPGVIPGCVEHLKEIHEQFGRKVSLIGWSLGGFYARELAKMNPEAVRQVITLGTPFTGDQKANNAWPFYQLVSGQKVGEFKYPTTLSEPPPVPTTSIYSRTDGVVNWKCCLEKEGPMTENIEVQASHIGMGVHPLTLYTIADRLAQPEGEWKHFEYFGFRRIFFPIPRRRDLTSVTVEAQGESF